MPSGTEGAVLMHSMTETISWVQGNDKYSEEVLNRWNPANYFNSNLSTGCLQKNNPNNFRISDFWMYKDDYFTVDRVQLSLNLPKTLAYKIATKDLILYLRGENLARLSKDAERRQLRIGSEPMYRNFALGLRIMF
ncbi:MAG: hypothetical protein AB2L24_24245 [Mangrovibacterium sp.]